MKSIYKFSYSTRYLLLHPWKLFHEIKVNITNAWHRVKYGWCWIDLWNMDTYLLDILPQMLHTLAAKADGYPGREPFETPEKWTEWLNSIADRLENCTEENLKKQNEYSEEYMKNLMNHGLHESTELDKKYFAREKELFAGAQKTVQECFTELGKHFYLLWD